MRENETILCGDLINKINVPKVNLQSISNTKIITDINKPTKVEMWQSFKYHFKILYGKDLIIDSQFKENIKALFLYFLEDKGFFECKNLRGDLSIPSFDKGLLVIGSYGIGKTAFFKVFESMFKHYYPLRFTTYSSKELKRRFETFQTPCDKENFYKEMERKRMFIDDLSAEKNASNYGLTDVVGEVLSLRYEKNLTTFATCNYLNNDNCVRQALIELGVRYEERIYDRLFEMFNIIEFKGLSLR